MQINHLDNYNIELSNIWNHEKEIFIWGLQQKEKTKYIIDQKDNIFDLYNKAISLCVYYGKSHLTKVKSGDIYLEFQKICKEKKLFRDRIELGWFDFKGALYYLPQTIIIPREDEDFHFFFALKVDQYDADVFKMDRFIRYQLEINFNWNTIDLMVFLENLIVQYDFISKRVRKKLKSLITDIKKLPKSSSDEGELIIRTPKTKNTPSSSYVLIASKTDSNHFLKNNQKFVDIFENLKEKNYIHQNTRYIDFKGIFSGEIVLPENRIHWIGKSIDLKAFIDYLCKNNKIEKPNSGIWKLTCQCFIDKNKKEFHPRRLGNSNPFEYTKHKIKKTLSRFP
ncbi:hypothetical protein ACSTS3_18590 [Aquimarina muelleri]|uniref:hypothetical protein n=1 Tax=Aquimarina muelleri TaxID=279356 RepID=UPI003F685FCA